MINIIVTHLAYKANAKNVIYQLHVIHSFESASKHALADAICYFKMTSVVALDDVTSFSNLKDITNTCKRM